MNIPIPKLRNSGNIIIIMLLVLAYPTLSSAQTDTVRMNTVRLNVTNPLIFGSGALVVGYERLLNNNQSFSVNLGKASYPKMVSINTDSIGIDLNSSYKDKGFNFSADYRFYMSKENKYPAPRGIYWGPYYSYNYFNRINNWTLNTDNFQGNVETELSMNIHTIGVEIGYQFVLWEKMSVDLIMIGPGVGFYNLKANINTDLSSDDESALFETIGDYLSQKIPGFDHVIDGAGFETNGSARKSSFGYRYMVMVGYRF